MQYDQLPPLGGCPQHVEAYVYDEALAMIGIVIRDGEQSLLVTPVERDGDLRLEVSVGVPA